MFNDVAKLKWEGVEYECPITMALVKQMERNGVNILYTRMQIEGGGMPPASLVAELFAYVLRAGGCDVTEDDIYTSIMSDPSHEDSIALLKAADYVSALFFPKIEGAERPTKKDKKPKK